MKLNKDLDPTNIQQMSQKPNKNQTNLPKNPTKKPNIDGRCWVLGSSKNPTFCWICWILVGFFLLGCRPQTLTRKIKKRRTGRFLQILKLYVPR